MSEKRKQTIGILKKRKMHLNQKNQTQVIPLFLA